MIDIHTHVLPGLDDGAAALEESVAMCRAAAAAGTETLVATPHLLHPQWEDINAGIARQGLVRLQEAVGRGPEIRLGAEIHVASDFLTLVDRLPDGPLLSLAGSRYLLLEMPFVPPLPDARRVVHETVLAGWVPVLAHPERMPYWIETPDELDELVELGATLQITAMALTGGFGRKVKRLSRDLVDGSLVHFVASDAHDAVVRPAVLDEAFAVVREVWGEQAAQVLFVDNPRAVVEDRPLPSAGAACSPGDGTGDGDR